MKLHITLIALLAIITTAMAVLIAPFTTWDDLTKKSSDIIIAGCMATPNPPYGAGDGMIWSDIEVVSVLKGDTKLGIARMVSQFCPRKGDRFLMFADYQSNQPYQAYNATETYRIVPLNPNFSTNELADKSLHDQIQLMLHGRYDEGLHQ